jgi:hypothetical protein
MQNDVVFATVAMLLIPFIVALVLALAERIGFVWATQNQPTIAAGFGGFLGWLYHLPSVYVALNGVPADLPLGFFIVGGIGVGFAAAGVKSFQKDVTTGALTATSVEDVKNMRKGEGIRS